LDSAAKDEGTKKEGSRVGIVMIKCPKTGSAISTGIKADRESFRCSAVFFARTHCPTCQASHEWFAREAWLYEPGEVADMLWQGRTVTKMAHAVIGDSVSGLLPAG
jgi:hypothetical protein